MVSVRLQGDPHCRLPCCGKSRLNPKGGYVVGRRRRASCKALSSAPGDTLSAQPCSPRESRGLLIPVTLQPFSTPGGYAPGQVLAG